MLGLKALPKVKSFGFVKVRLFLSSSADIPNQAPLGDRQLCFLYRVGKFGLNRIHGRWGQVALLPQDFRFYAFLGIGNIAFPGADVLGIQRAVLRVRFFKNAQPVLVTSMLR